MLFSGFKYEGPLSFSCFTLYQLPLVSSTEDSMAAITSSLIRNCAILSGRTFVTAKSKSKSYNLSLSNFLPPLYYRTRRSSIHVRASSEEAAAKAAATDADSGGPTIFDKIIAKEIPSSIVYEDEKVLAFRDVNPQAPVHVLVIPKFRDGLTQLSKAETRHAEILGQLLHAAKIVAEKEGIHDGFRIVINNGPSACQSVYHLHLHVLGGRQFTWPAG